MTENKQERVVLLSKGFGPQFEATFFLEIQEKILEGYRIAETGLLDDISMRNFRGRQGRAVLYLEGCEPEKFVPAEFNREDEPQKTEDADVSEDEKELSSGRASNEPVEDSEEDSQDSVKEEPTMEELDKCDSLKKLKEFASKYSLEIPASATTKAKIAKELEELIKS